MSETKVEKIRFERLKLVCRKALEQSIKKSLSPEQFKLCFPTIAGTDEGIRSLDLARSQMIGFWHENTLKEFDLIFQERNIDTKLNELDEIIQTAQRREQSQSELPAQIDKLTPTELINSTLLDGSESSLENLSMIYNQLCIDNKEMYTELQKLSIESDDLKTDINNSLETLRKEVEVIDSRKDKLNLDELIEKLGQ
ncbi:predicted protein [Scheffersomyces stipitis CBS 6054]|uniref:Kinetochore-associated protein n=1 Tax=Scheffersomyces stipitis (strain ATCC 58785 / CBS 6054 / NBRC 10063 / NRRL Y-11545) TaxID=322104 RepID=A3M0H0_PICST|nr:predicted protein [Scheffersomyces stipitis CBS 6054]ABN68523.2 predicted protein [Scheffersomyces stipitis CBS 6054]